MGKKPFQSIYFELYNIQIIVGKNGTFLSQNLFLDKFSFRNKLGQNGQMAAPLTLSMSTPEAPFRKLIDYLSIDLFLKK